MPEYTVATIVAVAAVLLIEALWLRTGVFSSPQYWGALGIVVFFQCLVDGWLTKLSDPIVLYAPSEFSGLRFPWDIPVEDFGFGFAMVTGTLLAWLKFGPGEQQ